MQRENSDVVSLVKETNYLWSEASLATSTTIGEAIYLSRKINMKISELRQSLAEYIIIHCQKGCGG